MMTSLEKVPFEKKVSKFSLEVVKDMTFRACVVDFATELQEARGPYN